MVKIESLKDYLNILDEEELESLSTKIYMIIDLICKDYPKYKEWFFTKQLPETINTNKRNILFVKNDKNEIISMDCLKKYETEQKICTLYVSDSCRGLGIGSAVIEESMKWLETTKPFITIADYKLEMFRPIIEKYNWKLTEIVSDYVFRIINQHLYMNIFDYIEQCEQNYELLELFSQLNPLKNSQYQLIENHSYHLTKF